MDYEIVTLEEKIVVGISARTNNTSPDMGAVIGGLWKRFYNEGIYASIPDKKSGKALGIYTEYTGNEKADYTTIVACETEREPQEGQYTVYRIPAGKYAKFVIYGDMVQAVAAAWQEIWQMDLPRAFQCDFEEYQSDAMDHAEIHIYVGLKEGNKDFIESRCGILCKECTYRGQGCTTGCIHIQKPFWADNCPIKTCCEERQYEHCGQCEEFPCALLKQFAYDKEQGDNGKRIEQCRDWKKKSGLAKL